jgi:L-rhamnose mutarotase
MSKLRALSVRRLKQECNQTYWEHHRAVWPKLLETYRQAGIKQIDGFLQGCDLIVLSEDDMDIYATQKDELAGNPVETRWKAPMETLRNRIVEQRYFEQVFHWENHG